LKVFKFIFIGVLAVILLFNIISIIQKFVLKEPIPLVLGVGNAVINSGSMEPAISVGDIIIINKQKDYKEDDVVTFIFPEDKIPTTHRIVEKTEGGFITQGDANNTADAEIKKEYIIGKVTAIVPKAGNVIWFLQSPFGAMVLILSLFASIELPKLLQKQGIKRSNSFSSQ